MAVAGRAGPLKVHTEQHWWVVSENMRIIWGLYVSTTHPQNNNADTNNNVRLDWILDGNFNITLNSLCSPRGTPKFCLSVSPWVLCWTLCFISCFPIEPWIRSIGKVCEEMRGGKPGAYLLANMSHSILGRLLSGPENYCQGFYRTFDVVVEIGEKKDDVRNLIELSKL